MTALLSVKDLRFAYPGGRPLLDGVSLNLDPGERVAIMGRSGAGKSTLLNILALMQGFVEGSCQLKGEELRGVSSARRRYLRARSIGMVFQSGFLIPYLTVRENVAAALAWLPPEEHPEEGRIERLLAGVGLAALADQRPNRLSGGEQQRAGLARALVKRPLLLLADEPTGNLDPQTSDQVLDLLLDREIFDGAVLMVTHDSRAAARFTRQAYMHEGRLYGARQPSIDDQIVRPPSNPEPNLSPSEHATPESSEPLLCASPGDGARLDRSGEER